MRVKRTVYDTLDTTYKFIIKQNSTENDHENFISDFRNLSIILETSSLFKWFLEFLIFYAISTDCGITNKQKNKFIPYKSTCSFQIY